MNDFRWITNASELALSQTRVDALHILESSLSAIRTSDVITRSLQLHGDTLRISAHEFDLSQFKRICVIGFGKAACEAAEAIEQALGTHIESGLVIGSETRACEKIETRQATHPLPSHENVAQTEHMMFRCRNPQPDDLFIVIVSGGGSAMLCWPKSECEQGRRLYRDALRSGMTIHELNTVRKHISELKGGGLAAKLSPAHVVGLIFSDIPGTEYGMVASGPTWPDASTVEDAQSVLDHYQLNNYDLNETPKDPALFQRVTNIVVASNRLALEAMAQAAARRGYVPHIVSDAFYGSPEEALHLLGESAQANTAILAGGEFKITVPNGGKGGRNTRATLTGLSHIREEQLFTAFASDGLDNTDACGAIADSITRQKMATAGLDIRDYLARYDDYSFFEKTGDLIMTGSTGANVSDLMMLLSP